VDAVVSAVIDAAKVAAAAAGNYFEKRDKILSFHVFKDKKSENRAVFVGIQQRIFGNRAYVIIVTEDIKQKGQVEKISAKIKDILEDGIDKTTYRMWNYYLFWKCVGKEVPEEEGKAIAKYVANKVLAKNKTNWRKKYPESKDYKLEFEEPADHELSQLVTEDFKEGPDIEFVDEKKNRHLFRIRESLDLLPHLQSEETAGDKNVEAMIAIKIRL